MTTTEPNGPNALDSPRGPGHDRPIVGDVVADPEPIIVAPRRRADLVFWLSAGWLGLMVLAALFATRLPLDDINKTDADHLFAPISWSHPMGTDSLGHDLFSQVVQGGVVLISVAFVLANVVADIIYTVLDPRVRAAGRS